jgi:hypothetical protein
MGVLYPKKGMAKLLVVLDQIAIHDRATTLNIMTFSEKTLCINGILVAFSINGS